MSFVSRRRCPSFRKSSCNCIDDPSQLIKGLLFSFPKAASMPFDLRMIVIGSFSSFVLILLVSSIMRSVGLRLVNEIL